jgi:drug/metabolite transporter (DMT)-like permease
MFGYSTSLALLLLSLLALAGSQLLIKWRFMVMDFDGLGLSSQSGRLFAVLTDPWLWLAGSLIMLGAAMWYVAMTRLPLTLMLPLAAVVTPIVVLVSHFVLKEPLTLGQLGAAVLIALGVVLLGLQQ